MKLIRHQFNIIDVSVILIGGALVIVGMPLVLLGLIMYFIFKGVTHERTNRTDAE